MKAPLFTGISALAFVTLMPLAAQAINYKIVTASPRGTYIEIGRDLGKLIGPEADIQLESLPSAGSAENVRRLRYEPDVKFALVQSDVYQAYLDQAAAGNGQAQALIQPLRVILPLYNEEIYFVARRDAKLDYVHEIQGQRISAGPLGSGTALTTATLYRRLFGQGIPEGNAQYQTNEEGLAKLVTDKSVDVVVIVAGQPSKVLSDMRPEARDLVKLLKFDPDHPSSKSALQTYFRANVTTTSYPNLLSEDLPSIAVKAFLVTYNYSQTVTTDALARFGQSLCNNFPKLQAEGHPKWKEVKLEMPPLGRGWRYFPATEKVLANCGKPPVTAPTVTRSPTPSAPRCQTQEERALGLCGR